MKMRWSLSALLDRREAYDSIEADQPDAALRVDQAIENATQRLLDFPLTGRPGRVTATPELPIPRTPYVAVYVVEPDLIRILRLLHGAQRWPAIDLEEDE